MKKHSTLVGGSVYSQITTSQPASRPLAVFFELEQVVNKSVLHDVSVKTISHISLRKPVFGSRYSFRIAWKCYITCSFSFLFEDLMQHSHCLSIGPVKICLKSAIFYCCGNVALGQHQTAE